MAISTVEALCNVALDRIGWPERITNIYEGTRHANVALRAYGEARDDLLKRQDWDFAERYVAAALSGYAAPPGWSYSLTWPSDCLKLRYVAPVQGTSPNLDPRPTLFDDANVPGTPSSRVVLSNTYPATLFYTGQILDISQWDAGFVDALIQTLAQRFVPMLGKSLEMLAPEAALAEKATADLAASQSTTPSDAFQPREDRR